MSPTVEENTNDPKIPKEIPRILNTRTILPIVLTRMTVLLSPQGSLIVFSIFLKLFPNQ